MSHSPPEPTHLREDARSILDSIRRIVRGLRVWGRACERDLGIGGAQLFILQKIEAAQPVSVNELSELTLTHQSTVSVIVSRLVEKGFVERNTSPEDARRAELSLTSTGRKLLEQAPESAQESIIAAILRMTPEQGADLANLLDILVKEAGLYQEIAPLIFDEKAEAGSKQRRQSSKGASKARRRIGGIHG